MSNEENRQLIFETLSYSCAKPYKVETKKATYYIYGVKEIKIESSVVMFMGDFRLISFPLSEAISVEEVKTDTR